VATLGRRYGCYGVNWPELTILGCREMSGDQFGSGIVKFDGHIRH
jgi:hypothetical protein